MKTRNKILLLAVLAFGAAAFTAALFALSEKKARFHNRFIRKFPSHMAELRDSRELPFNSYYFAGHGNGLIYLGNTTAPFVVTVLDSALKTVSVSKINIEGSEQLMQYPALRVNPPFFYFYEGSVPFVYSGSIMDWKAQYRSGKGDYFSQAQAVGGNSFVARYTDPVTAKNSIRIAEFHTSGPSTMSADLLAGTGGDVFDTDGTLIYDRTAGSVAYVFYYKNTFFTADRKLADRIEGKTIDTVSIPAVKAVSIEGRNQRTFAGKPLLVNRLAAADGGLLYVNSQLPGHFEPLEMWKNSSIIDIYDPVAGAYLSSIYIADIEGRKPGSIVVDGNSLYALSGRQIVRYSINKKLVKRK